MQRSLVVFDKNGKFQRTWVNSAPHPANSSQPTPSPYIQGGVYVAGRNDVRIQFFDSKASSSRNGKT